MKLREWLQTDGQRKGVLTLFANRSLPGRIVSSIALKEWGLFISRTLFGVFPCPHLSIVSRALLTLPHLAGHVRKAQLTHCTDKEHTQVPGLLLHLSQLGWTQAPKRPSFVPMTPSANAYLTLNLLNPLVIWSFLSLPPAKPESRCSQGPSCFSCMSACLHFQVRTYFTATSDIPLKSALNSPYLPWMAPFPGHPVDLPFLFHFGPSFISFAHLCSLSESIIPTSLLFFLLSTPGLIS